MSGKKNTQMHSGNLEYICSCVDAVVHLNRTHSKRTSENVMLTLLVAKMSRACYKNRKSKALSFQVGRMGLCGI